MNKGIISFVAAACLLASAPSAGVSAKKTLKSTVGKHFLIGTIVNDDQVQGRGSDKRDNIIRTQFNSIVAENCMKGECIHPEEDRFFWDDADRFVDYGIGNGMAIIGHCLVWHSQPPKWMFTDAKGNYVSREVLIERMRRHIYEVAGRYKGKIKGWDVVNEAIEDDGSFRKTHYYNIIGPDYIELAFRFAHEADPDAELYYNDYSMAKPGKRATVCKLVRDLKKKGLRIDAVGMQSHNGIDYPDLKEYEASIDSFAALGVKVQITEMEINMLPNPDSFGGAEISTKYQYDAKYNPYPDGLSKEMNRVFEDRYLAFFDIFRRHASQIERVTLWGVDDGSSWLNDWPIKGRTNYPLLFDRKFKAKPVVKKIMKMFE